MSPSRRRTARRAAHFGGAAGLVALAAVAGCRAGATRGSIVYDAALEKLASGDSIAAFALFEDAAFAAPKDARVHYRLGVLLARRGTFESRAQAERELRTAVGLAPDVADYQAALGDVQHTQGFSHAAQTSLRRAVQLDPKQTRAWYLLGLELLDEYRETFSDAGRDSTLWCFENALDLDAPNADARWKLACLLVERGQPERARVVARRGFAPGSCPGRWGSLLASIEFRAQRPLAATAVLDSTLACLSAKARDSLLAPDRLVHPDSAFCWQCTPAEREAAIEDFWWSHDPTPATALNERLLEHVSRSIDADFWFSVPRFGLLGRDTDRGEIYLRYGKPDFAWKSSGGWRSIVRWSYYANVPRSGTFRFVNLYAPLTYHRLRRGTGDAIRLELFDLAPQRTRLDFGAKPKGWRQVARLFRARGGRTALELAFGFETGPELDSLHVDAAAWRGPGRRAAVWSRGVPLGDLYHVDDRHVVGRLRFEVPSGWLEIGLQVVAAGQDSVPRPRGKPMWTWMGRDTLDVAAYDARSLGLSDLMPTHVLQRSTDGGAFDLGGMMAVPRVDSEITSGRLDLYFEIYPGQTVLRARQCLYVTYRVQALPPRRWRFRDQFSPEIQARREHPTFVESKFRLEPTQAVEPQELHIDVHSLEPGDYTLTVEVQPHGLIERVTRSVDFSIPAPLRAAR